MYISESLDSNDPLLQDLQHRVREEAKVSVGEQGQVKFSVWISFAEIYNEQIYDLLVSLPKKKNARRPCLKLSEDRNGSPYIKGSCFVISCFYLLLVVYENMGQILPNKLHGPMHYKIGVTCVYNGHMVYTLLY